MSMKTIVNQLPGTLVTCIHLYSILTSHRRLILYAPPQAISAVGVYLKQLREIQLTGKRKESPLI